MTKRNWTCQYREGLILGKNADVGAFSYTNAKFGVEIQEEAQIGSHCSICSWSTIDDRKGKVLIKKNAGIAGNGS
jgi:acyl-[acyl carrier protein]--UDP-N-acetylglucosamine O-acyltransferase